MSILGGVLIAILGELVASHLLGMLNIPDDVLPSALMYLRIYLLGMPVILLYNFEAAIFRSIGGTKSSIEGTNHVRHTKRSAEPVLRHRF